MFFLKWIPSCCSFIIIAMTKSDVSKLKMPNVNLSVWLLCWRNATVSDAYLQTKVRWDIPACPWEHSGIWETNGAETTFFIPFPSVCAPLTHTTQQGTHVMHHAVISDSEVEVITLGSPLPFFSSSFPLPSIGPSQQLNALMSAIDLVTGDNSFHHRDTPWWTGVPWTPRLIPGPVLQHASIRGSVSDAWRVYWSATGGQPGGCWCHSLLAVSLFPWASS